MVHNRPKWNHTVPGFKYKGYVGKGLKFSLMCPEPIHQSKDRMETNYIFRISMSYTPTSVNATTAVIWRCVTFNVHYDEKIINASCRTLLC
jgi:hypothetical protein